MQWATHFDVAGTAVHSREDELGQQREDHDPVSVDPASFGLCAVASLSLLFRLKGPLHHGAYLLLRTVVVVGNVLAFALGRHLPDGCHQFLSCLGCGNFPVPSDDC